jgi:hypothetical protein
MGWDGGHKKWMDPMEGPPTAGKLMWICVGMWGRDIVDGHQRISAVPFVYSLNCEERTMAKWGKKRSGIQRGMGE